MQTIKIGSDVNNPLFEFTDPTIQTCQAVLCSSLTMDELAIDQFMPVLYSAAYLPLSLQSSDEYKLLSADGFQLVCYSGEAFLDAVPYGTPIWYFSDSDLIGKFYVSSITRTGKTQFSVLAVSAVGVLDGQQHLGGIYTGETFSTVLTDIVDGAFTFSCAPDVASVPVFGWLPIGTKRSNLHQLLFATGVMLDKDVNGDLYFRFQDSSNVVQVPDSRIYLQGGTISYLTQASRAEVTEHSFISAPSDETVTLFDNTDGSGTAVNTFVAFSDAPIHDLSVTGSLTIDSSDVNWAIVSGVGTLTGQKYTHVTKVIAQTASADTEKTVSVTDATLVSVLNSINVTKRVLSFYNAARQIAASLVLDGERAGDQLGFNDPFGDPATAFLSEMSINASSFLKADAQLITGYVPSGGGNNFSQAIVLTGSGTYQFPGGTENALVVLIGGGTGGEAGAMGYYPALLSTGGAGGTAGDGGDGGNIYQVALTSPTGTFSFSCGSAGVGGVPLRNPLVPATNPGTSGTDTTFGVYSSASGTKIAAGVVNLFTGVVYGAKGSNGINGSDGTDSSKLATFVTWNNQTWNSGSKAEDWPQYNRFLEGGYGGGAAVGSNGNNGEDGRYDAFHDEYNGGRGGDGGSALIAGASAASYGCGGSGGHGGGGGGAGGYGSGDKAYHGSGGTGGYGSAGGDAAAGCIIIYL